MRETTHILVVEDDMATQALLSAYLSDAGFRVTTAATAASMRAVLAGGEVDLVMLDLNLPDDDGIYVAQRLRHQSTLPIIMLSVRTDTRDRIAGLEIGADDYITKPFHPRELIARVRNVLARSDSKAAAAEPKRAAVDGVVYRFAGWQMDLLWRRLTSPAGEIINMTATEFDLLAVLVAQAGEPLTRDQLLEATGAPGRSVNDRSIDTLISRVRRKIGDTRAQRMIETCHGQGYRFTATVE